MVATDPIQVIDARTCVPIVLSAGDTKPPLCDTKSVFRWFPGLLESRLCNHSGDRHAKREAEHYLSEAARKEIPRQGAGKDPAASLSQSCTRLHAWGMGNSLRVR